MITPEIINQLRESDLIVLWYRDSKERKYITMKDVIEHYEGRESNG